MHRRVVVLVSTALFALLSLAVVVVADLHDRGYPEELDAKASVTLDFSPSELSDEAAFQQMGEISDRLSMGLVKVAPDLTGDQSGQVYVTLGQGRALPERIERFGNEPDAQVRDHGALVNSYASGQYLVTGETSGLPAFRTWLGERKIRSEWAYDTVGGTLMLVAQQGSFAVSLLAAVALMVAMVLYWLSVKARGRALRVLAGVPTWRIQYEDLAGFLACVLVAAAACNLVAIAYVGLAHGWQFAPYYASTLLVFNAVVLVITMVCALVMSFASWPSAEMLAAREPAVKSLRRTSVVLKAALFALVLASVAPAVAAYSDARETAAQQAQWKSLADQVALDFPAALGESGIQKAMGRVGAVVQAAEADNSVALSYAWDGESSPGSGLGSDRHLALVNQRWLDLMAAGGHTDLGLVPLSRGEVPEDARHFLEANLALWSRSPGSAAQGLHRFSYYRSSSLPVALGGNGDLVFPKDAVLLVAPELHALFNDSYLASTASTKNLLFTGLGPTQALLAQHDLQRTVTVKYAAEEGVLRAQVTAYFAWLQGVSFLSLNLALVVAAVLGAFITAVLKARRDFPLRLAGKRWSEILSERVVAEWALGLGLATLVVLFRGAQDGLLVAAVATGVLLLSPVTHLVAARWAFARVAVRQL